MQDRALSEYLSRGEVAFDPPCAALDEKEIVYGHGHA